MENSFSPQDSTPPFANRGSDQPRQAVFLNSVRKLYPSIALAVAAFCDAVRAQRSADLHGRLSDDFASNTIDTNKYQPMRRFLRASGDIHAWREMPSCNSSGTTTQRWWSGARCASCPPLRSEGANVAVSIDRVAEAGLGSASRSALWILDETRTKYVLFADVRGEGNWHYTGRLVKRRLAHGRRPEHRRLRRRDLLMTGIAPDEDCGGRQDGETLPG